MNEKTNHMWHEFQWQSAPKMPPGPHKRLKLYADANIPRVVIDELKAAGLPVETAVQDGRSTHADESIAQRTRQQHRVLLTLDRDFWNDRQHPLGQSPGIIFVDIPPDQPERAIDGLARFYGLFARYFPLNWWEGMKARVSEHRFVIRCYTWDGQISEEEFRLAEDGKLYTRRLR